MYFLMMSSSPQCVKTYMERCYEPYGTFDQLEVLFYLCSKTFYISYNTGISDAARAHFPKTIQMILENFFPAKYEILIFLQTSLSPR